MTKTNKLSTKRQVSKHLVQSYIKINEILDRWDKDLNVLSKSTAKAYRDLISDPASYANKPTKEEISKVVALFDRLLNEYKINYDEKDLFKDYTYYHTVSVVQLIFNSPKGYMELSPMSDCLTEDAKKELKNIEKLHDIIDVFYNEVINKLYVFSTKNNLPTRIDTTDIKRKEKGLPADKIEEVF